MRCRTHARHSVPPAIIFSARSCSANYVSDRDRTRPRSQQVPTRNYPPARVESDRFGQPKEELAMHTILPIDVISSAYETIFLLVTSVLTLVGFLVTTRS